MNVSLTWPGKRIASAEPAVVTPTETFEPARSAPAPGEPLPTPFVQGDMVNSVFYGDNLPVLAHLRTTALYGQIKLIYADPPYDSGVDWTRKVRLRGPRQQGIDPVVGQQVAYADTWQEGEYLQFMYERLLLARDLLAADGSLWLHCDHRHAHHLRCILEEVFGPDNYLNTITWRSQTARGAKVSAFYFPNSAHTILVFAKNRAAPTCWNPPKKKLVLSEAEAAAAFMRDERGFFRTSDPGTYSFDSLKRLHSGGRLYAPYAGAIAVDEERQRVYASNGGNIGVKYYLTDLGNGRHLVERAVDNIWDDIAGLGTTPGEDLGYPTQKTEALLERIIATATRPGDWVLDPFLGSGTTLAVAQKLGRRWVGCDASYGAVQTAVGRLQAIVQAQHTAGAPDTAGFAVYRSSTAAVPSTSDLLVNLSITRIDGEQARIQVAVHGIGLAPGDGAVDLPGGGDWRLLISRIAIDPAYDGVVLRVALADAPLKKTQRVTGVYELPIARQPTTVAVRVVDIWGREATVTKVV